MVNHVDKTYLHDRKASRRQWISRLIILWDAWHIGKKPMFFHLTCEGIASLAWSVYPFAVKTLNMTTVTFLIFLNSSGKLWNLRVILGTSEQFSISEIRWSWRCLTLQTCTQNLNIDVSGQYFHEKQEAISPQPLQIYCSCSFPSWWLSCWPLRLKTSSFHGFLSSFPGWSFLPHRGPGEWVPLLSYLCSYRNVPPPSCMFSFQAPTTAHPCSNELLLILNHQKWYPLG